jgi:hypothetical protein
MVDTNNFSIWINFIIPTLIAPLIVSLKSLWDRYNTHKLEKKILIEKNVLEITKIKLEKFYWPIYIRLLKIYQIEDNIKMENTYRHKKDDELNDTASSVSSNTSDDEDDEINWFMVNKKQKSKLYKIKILEDDSFLKLDDSLKKNDSILLDIEESNNDSPINKKIHYLDIEGEVLNNILLNIFEIYCEVEDIIVKYIHISETNKRLRKELLKFLKFITILKILKKNNKNNLNPSDFGANYPKKLLDYIEKYVNFLQKKYNTLRIGKK